MACSSDLVGVMDEYLNKDRLMGTLVPKDTLLHDNLQMRARIISK